MDNETVSSSGHNPGYTPEMLEKIEAAVINARPGDEIDTAPFGYYDDVLGWNFDEALCACHELVRRGLPLIPEHHRDAVETSDSLQIKVAGSTADLGPYRLKLMKEVQRLQDLIGGVEKAQKSFG